VPCSLDTSFLSSDRYASVAALADNDAGMFPDTDCRPEV